ncbi:HD domain-containing protein, partial [Faecalibacterium duncaniae]|uniref:HD domain-containing protein n=1 Tax=Faecalibacterium duncaniae (strain DSM 17677 / JCM 31915 / A2-165) TaxID=411483 RepID=UPI0029418E2E
AFGEEVALLVDGVTKLTKIQFSNIEELQAENLRKMLLAMSRDDRTPVGIVGVADTFSFFRGIIHKVEQFFGLLALKIRCLSHQ